MMFNIPKEIIPRVNGIPHHSTKQRKILQDFYENFIRERNRLIVQVISFLKTHMDKADDDVCEATIRLLKKFDHTYSKPRNCVDIALTCMYGPPSRKMRDKGNRTPGAYMAQLFGQMILEEMPIPYIEQYIGIDGITQNPEACDSDRESRWFCLEINGNMFESERITTIPDLICAPSSDISILDNPAFIDVFGNKRVSNTFGQTDITTLQIKTMCSSNEHWHSKMPLSDAKNKNHNELTFFTQYNTIKRKMNIEDVIPEDELYVTSFLISLRMMQICCKWGAIPVFENKKGWCIPASCYDYDLIDLLERGKDAAKRPNKRFPSLLPEPKPDDTEVLDLQDTISAYNEDLVTENDKSGAAIWVYCLRRLYGWDPDVKECTRLPYGYVTDASLDRDDIIKIADEVIKKSPPPNMEEFKGEVQDKIICFAKKAATV